MEVKKLTKYYADIPAVVDVSFDVAKGTILGFLGPNGAGKSTTMKVLNCFLPPTAGSARVAGFDVFENSLEVRKRVGYLPENPSFYDEMTPEGYLKFCAKIRGLPRADRAKRIREVMERVAIGDVRKRLIGHLSKGYRQRVGIAQALLHNPPVLILDEPTSGLDPRQIIETRELIKSLRGDHTVILSTHILPEVSQVCDEVVIINNGRVVAEDSPEHLNQRLRGTQQITVEVRGPGTEVAHQVAELPNVSAVSEIARGKEIADGICRLSVESAQGHDVRESVAASIVGSGWGLREISTKAMSLEEIYLQLTTDEAAEDMRPATANEVTQ
ncbi:MAG: ABC transporter ATP-binding protein [Candidatus Schekmanbacteria bacterium]|nr:ABC transporter ATP-binding protein [Candidatus Schekmanbacteria bacterium]